MRFFLYARKSTDVEDKQVLSIEAQLSELRALAKREGLEIAEEFVEKRSAKMPGRPVFNEMMARIQKGEAQGIVCWKLDRLARNPVDGGQIQWLLQENIIRHILTHDRSHYPTDNVLMMSVEFGMANQFIRDLSSNVKRGLRAKVKNGEFPSTAPVGYLNDVRAKTIVIDRKKSKVIRAAFELYAKGNSRLEDITSASVQELRVEMHNISRKLDRLTDLYIAQDIERGDYLSRRRTLVLEKKSVEERVALLERNAGYWLEPMRAWVKDASLLDEAAKSKDLPSKNRPSGKSSARTCIWKRELSKKPPRFLTRRFAPRTKNTPQTSQVLFGLGD